MSTSKQVTTFTFPGLRGSSSQAPKCRFVRISRIHKRLGKGNTGEVFDATTTKGKRVAVKVFYSRKADFEREVQVLRHLRRNSSAVFASHFPKYYGRVAMKVTNSRELRKLNFNLNTRSGLAIVMELLRGQTFRQWIDSPVAAMLLDHRLDVVEGTLHTLLDELHSINVVHGDINENNIMLEELSVDGIKTFKLVLIDWACSKVFSPKERKGLKSIWQDSVDYDFEKSKDMFGRLREKEQARADMIR